MKKLERMIFMLLLLVANLCGAHGAVEQVEYRLFDRFTTENGLIGNRIYDMCEDSRGYIWLATDYGVDRFDGSVFRHFSLKEYPELERWDMHVVAPSPLGVEVGSADGVAMEYSFDEDRFIDRSPRDYAQTYFKETQGFYKDSRGNRFLNTADGLFVYDTTECRYSTLFKAYRSVKGIYARSLLVDSCGRYWVGSIEKMLILSPSGRLIKLVGHGDGFSGMVTEIDELPDGRVLVSTMGGDMYVCSLSAKGEFSIKKIKLPFQNLFRVRFSIDGEHIYYATDGDGLWMSGRDPDNLVFTRVRPYGADEQQMRKIYALCEDHKGNIWVGTQTGGIFRLRAAERHPVVFSSNYGISGFICSDFCDLDGNFYIASDGMGLYRTSRRMRDLKKFKLECDNVLSMEAHTDGKIWLNTWGSGCIVFDPRTEQSYTEQFEGLDMIPKCIFTSTELSDGSVVVSSGGMGLVKRKAGQTKWTNVAVPDMWVFRTVEGKDGVLWAVTTNTIWRIDGDSIVKCMQDVTSEKSHNPLGLADIATDDEGNAYVATSKGILKISADGKTLEKQSYMGELNHISVRHLKGKEFATVTDASIIVFDAAAKNFYEVINQENQKVKNIFYRPSLMASSDGRIYVGTHNGFYDIDLNNVIATERLEQLSFGRVLVAGNKVPIDTELNRLCLEYDQASNISIEVNAVDVTSKMPCVLHYRIKGLNDEWRPTTPSHDVRLSFLPDGNYELEIRIVEPNGQVVGDSLSMNILVLPPWWKTPWALGLWFLLGALLVFAFVWFKLRSVTRQSQLLRQKVDERTSELRVALADKDRLIAVIAHDLKNPMFGIVGALDRIRKQDPTVDSIYTQAVFLQNEMTQLVDWAKEKHESLQPQMTSIDVERAIDQELELLRGYISSKEISVEKRIELFHYAYADSRLLETMIRNLINNAVKFSHRGGNIVVSAIERERRILVSVIDNGVGMSDTQQRELLQSNSYQHTEGTELEDSHGLGFNIVKDYAARLGTKIFITSKLGEGTDISFALDSTSIVLMQKGDAASSVVIDSQIMEGNTILIVDDDDLIRDNLNDLLSPYFTTLVASDGQQAYEVAQNCTPDIIVSDVQMPRMNGIELCRRIVTDSKFDFSSLLFMSANSEDTDKIQGLKVGAVDYITKPFASEELLLKICNILAVRRRIQQSILNGRLRDEEPKSGETINPFLSALLQFIADNYQDSHLSVEQMASALSVSISTLNRRTRSLTDKTPVELISEYRLSQARKLLEQGHLSVTDVAYQTGYSDVAYFSRKFKERFDISPSAVKK